MCFSADTMSQATETEAINPLNDHDSNREYCKIGAGSCGTVWTESEGSRFAYKREDGTRPAGHLSNDYEMHGRVLQAIEAFSNPNKILVPARDSFVGRNDAWWSTNLARFAPDLEPCNLLISECIQPVGERIRRNLIDSYCPGSIQELIRTNERDRDCLVRLYYGRRRFRACGERRFGGFSLRNFPLHIDQMVDIGINMDAHLKTMAEALAIMHWSAGIDADDVEFVLGAPRSKESEPCLWVLDFDCCKPITMDEDGVNAALEAFFRNDPYFPRPKEPESRDKYLWEASRDRYLAVSQEILGCDMEHLATSFVCKVERIQQERRKSSRTA